ncbi:MAG: GDSL-type esterase/lipase family protein [Actinomycetota bacterium]
MPDRYGMDANGDGLTDPYWKIDVTPAGWTVHFNGCASVGGDGKRWSITKFMWNFGDGTQSTKTPWTDCKVKHDFATEKTYIVTLTVRDQYGGIHSVAQDVKIDDLLIIGLGDSVASGEGNPEITKANGGPKWNDKQCHRSALAGQARAAQRIEGRDAHTSVTFVHLACSGATILEGLLGRYEGIEPVKGSVKKPQITVARTVVKNRTIDAVLLSIGANDLDFGTIVRNCFYGPCTDPSNKYDVTKAFARKVANKVLEKRYARLAQCLTKMATACELANGGLDVLASRIYLIEYFNPTLDEDGVTYCLGDGPLGYNIQPNEMKWADENVITHLNGEVGTAAFKYGWTLIGGISTMFEKHGICAGQQRWIVDYDDSDAVQGDVNGIMHPNNTGHFATGVRIAEGTKNNLP